MISTRSLTKAAAAAGLFVGLSFGGPAQALVVTLTPIVGTISGSETYTTNETIDFKFTIDAPDTFVFTAIGDGGSFPFPITETASGTSGTFTEVYGPFPVHGTVDYSLTSAVPEASTWAMMLLGFAGLGFAYRRTTKKFSGAFSAA
jgi:hypothetical protein